MATWDYTVTLRYLMEGTRRGNDTVKQMLSSIADVLEKKLLPDNWEDSDDLDMWVELSDLVSEMREVPENVSVAQVDELLDELYGWADFHRVWIE